MKMSVCALITYISVCLSVLPSVHPSDGVVALHAGMAEQKVSALKSAAANGIAVS